MAGCCKGSSTCSCKIEAGQNITITGSGTVSDPFVLSAELTAGPLDTAYIDAVVAAAVQTAVTAATTSILNQVNSLLAAHVASATAHPQYVLMRDAATGTVLNNRVIWAGSAFAGASQGVKDGDYEFFEG